MRRKLLYALVELITLLSAINLVGADDVTVSATVNSYITATFNYNSVSFGSLDAGTSDTPAPNQASGVYNVTIDTNKDFELTASGTDFSDGAGHSFAISNLKLDSDTSAGNLVVGNAVALSTSSQTIDTNIPASTTTHYHGYWISIPSGQYAASYSATVTLTYAVV